MRGSGKANVATSSCRHMNTCLLISTMIVTTSKKTVTLPDGRKLAYRLSGAASDPVILLSNSFGVDSTLWEPVTDYLTANGYSTVAYDHVGHGDSDAPTDPSQTSLELLVDDVAHLLEQLHIEHLAAWIGVSLGGSIGMEFAIRHPNIVDKLIICGTPMVSLMKMGIMPREAIVAMVKAAQNVGSMSPTMQHMAQRWADEDWSKAHPQDMDRLRQSYAKTTVEGFEAVSQITGDESYDFFPRMPDVVRGCRQIQLVYGARDRPFVDGIGEIEQAFRQAQREIGKPVAVRADTIPDAGHIAYFDGLEPFCRIVLEFLKAT